VEPLHGDAQSGQDGPCQVARATGVGADHQRSVCAQCPGRAADRACLPRHRRDHPYAAPEAPRNAHEVPLAHKALLPCQVALPGRPQGKGPRSVADGPGAPVTGTAACPARKCGSLHARLEPRLRAARLCRDTAGRSDPRQRAGNRGPGGNPPRRHHHQHRQGAHRHRARHPLPQAAEKPTALPDHQKAELLQKVLTALEEIAAGEKQSLSPGRAPRPRPAAQSHP